MSEDYLKFVEEDSSYDGFNRFEKVLMAVKRAKDIHDRERERDLHPPYQPHQGLPGVTPTRERAKKFQHKATYRAMLEINESRIKLSYNAEPLESETPELSTREESVASPVIETTEA